MKKAFINDRGFIPLVGLVVIVVVAIIAAGSIYYVARQEKSADTNVAEINANSHLNRNANINSNANVNANGNINTNGNSNTNVSSNKIITVTSPVNGGQYAKNTVRVQGDTRPNYQIQAYLGEVSCIDRNTYSGGGAGSANANGHFDFLLNYQAYQGDSVSLVVAAVPDLSIYQNGKCVPDENQTESITINFSSTVSVVPEGLKTYTNTTAGISFQHPTTWATWVQSATEYHGETEHYPPSGENISLNGKELRLTNGGTSDDPERFVLADSNNFTRKGDGGGGTVLKNTGIPTSSDAIASTCLSRSSQPGAIFIECRTVGATQAVASIRSDIDTANYYLVVQFAKTTQGYDRWSAAIRLSSQSGTPSDEAMQAIVRTIQSNNTSDPIVQAKQALYAMLDTWSFSAVLPD